MSAGAVVAASAVARDLGLALTFGGLLSIAGVWRAGGAAALRVARVTRIAAAGWAVASVVFALSSYSAIALRSPTEPGFGAEAWAFLTGVSLGQVYLQLAIAAVVTSVAVGFVEKPVHAGWALLPVGWGFAAQSLTGHAAGATDHHLAVSSMFVHLVGASMWLGVVVALVAARRSIEGEGIDAISRVSRLAAWAVALVILSGLVNSALRLGGPDDVWGTTYGRLLALKVALSLVVIGLGAVYRASMLARLADARIRERFWRLVAGETAVMATIVGLAVVLSRSEPPVPIAAVADPSPAWVLTGYPLPPSPTLATWTGLWRFELITALGIVVAGIMYARWIVRLRRRGDRWPIGRTAAWFTGLALLAWVTQGGPAIYGIVTFSGHMLQHMLLVMVVPIPLALGAPVTLAYRAWAPRPDGSRGPREWLTGFLESRALRFFAHPVVAAANFAGSMALFYYTPVFGWVLRNHIGHVWMVLHFVLVGYLLVNALVGIDPGPRRLPYPMRLVVLFATMAFHAFFGVAVMASTELLVPRWFGLMGRDWGPDALTDQQLGGQIAWGIGELPVLMLAIGVVVAWRREDARAARRGDRQADRDHDEELRRYNAMLAGLDAPHPDQK